MYCGVWRAVYGADPEHPPAYSRDWAETLREETLSFRGQVLLSHGDTHWQRTDQPLRTTDGRRVLHFTRTESFGYPFMGWTRIVIDDQNPALFRLEAHTWPPSKP